MHTDNSETETTHRLNYATHLSPPFLQGCAHQPAHRAQARHACVESSLRRKMGTSSSSTKRHIPCAGIVDADVFSRGAARASSFSLTRFFPRWLKQLGLCQHGEIEQYPLNCPPQREQCVGAARAPWARDRQMRSRRSEWTRCRPSCAASLCIDYFRTKVRPEWVESGAPLSILGLGASFFGSLESGAGSSTSGEAAPASRALRGALGAERVPIR